MFPMRRNSSNSGGMRQLAVSIAAANPAGSMRGVLSVMPPPVMCAAPLSSLAAISARMGFK